MNQQTFQQPQQSFQQQEPNFQQQTIQQPQQYPNAQGWGSKTSRTRRKTKSKNDACHFCGKFGHWVRECPAKFGRPSAQGPSPVYAPLMQQPPQQQTLTSTDNVGQPWYPGLGQNNFQMQ